MTDESKPIKIEFAPGAFDNFDGTQEELDEFIAEIPRMVESGEFLEKSKPVDIETLSDEELEKLAPFLMADDDESVADIAQAQTEKRRLN